MEPFIVDRDYKIEKDSFCWVLSKKAVAKKAGNKIAFKSVGFYPNLRMLFIDLAELKARDHFPDLNQVRMELIKLQERIEELYPELKPLTKIKEEK